MVSHCLTADKVKPVGYAQNSVQEAVAKTFATLISWKTAVLVLMDQKQRALLQRGKLMETKAHAFRKSCEKEVFAGDNSEGDCETLYKMGIASFPQRVNLLLRMSGHVTTQNSPSGAVSHPPKQSLAR